jgi:hypothetical protein
MLLGGRRATIKAHLSSPPLPLRLGWGDEGDASVPTPRPRATKQKDWPLRSTKIGRNSTSSVLT